MRVLIIGGGRFLGRSFADEALRAGHDVTVFNRGQTSVDTPGTAIVRGDRSDPVAISKLIGEGPWDAVVDTCNTPPNVVGQNARALADHAQSYLFVSSVSAFTDWPSQPLDGDSALFEGAPDASDGDYGALKAGAERAVREAFGDRALILYPGLIIGPYEDQGRQTWWLSRLARGGTTLAPGAPDREIRLIDARDIARFGLSCLAAGRHGGFVVTSPPGHVTFGEWLRAAAESTGSGADLTWAPDDVLLDAGVDEWVGLPLWASADGDARAVWDIDVAPALAAGLDCRPIRETVDDTWQWLKSGPATAAPDDDGKINGNGLAPADEQRILTLLADRRAG
jgi:2'-hydroxyisoflavone reductase